MMNIRAAAAKVLLKVVEGRSLSDVLPEMLVTIKDPRDQALLQAICYGVCRWFYHLDGIANEMIDTPLKEKDQDIHLLILVGLYQLIDMRIPSYAAVGETVNAEKAFKKPWARGFINGVLRQFLRDTPDIDEASYYYSHPEWFADLLNQAWPDYVENVLAANNVHPPLTLRVNERAISREEYLKKLEAENIEAVALEDVSCGITLPNPLDVKQLPGFADGEISVQDAGAQLAALFLNAQPGEYILDACCAPGGKTAHILEHTDNVELLAIDNNLARMEKVRDNLTRLKLTAECVCDDVADVDKWWNGKLFDRILLDAPCSASGVIRRHPDIKLLRRPSDIPALATEQHRLLQALWPLLKPNGTLLYVTCSVFPEENAELITQFLAKQKDAKEETLDLPWALDCSPGKQILPGMHDMDGFYYVQLRKV